ncbi:MAG: PDC sensor domain-containing protein, partial [Planctomycetota bacterium]
MQLALFRDLVAGILLLGTVFILVAYIGGRRTVRPLAQRVIEQAETRVGSSVGRVFDLPPRLLEVMETWIRSDLVNLDEPAVLDRLVQPLIKELPELSSAIIAADDGREYLLERNDDTWSRRLMPPGRGPRLATWRIWTNSVNEYTDRAGELDYDSSSRPWYIGVTARKQTGDLSPFWTRPYTFFNTPVLGMTVAQSVQAPNGDEFIIGLDVRLESLTVLTQGMTVMQGGVAFAIDEGRVIGLPGVPLYNQGPLDDLNARFEDMQDRLVPNALEALGALSGPILDPVRFRYDERHWWAHAKRLEQANRNIVIGIAIPEATVMGDISR